MFVIRLAAGALVAACAAPLSAAPAYDEPNFYEPAGWNVGDAGSTYQLWHEFPDVDNAPVEPDAGGWIGSPTPTLTIAPPAYMPGPGRTYSVAAPYGVTAAISNPDPAGAGLGTHVVVQIAASVNPDFGTYLPGTLNILDAGGNVILDGGEAADALRATDHGLRQVISAFGPVDFQESILEFFLPGYTGDFRVAWTHSVHSGIEAVRIDSYHAAEAVALINVPEPASLALLGAAALFAFRRR